MDTVIYVKGDGAEAALSHGGGEAAAAGKELEEHKMAVDRSSPPSGLKLTM